MGLCYSLRSRLAAARPSVPYGGRGEADPPPVTAEHGDPQVRHRLRQDLVAKERADKKRSKSIDKTLKAEKREYKQTHRLLLLGERRAGRGRRLPPCPPGTDRGRGLDIARWGTGRWLHLGGSPKGSGGPPSSRRRRWGPRAVFPLLSFILFIYLFFRVRSCFGVASPSAGGWGGVGAPRLVSAPRGRAPACAARPGAGRGARGEQPRGKATGVPQVLGVTPTHGRAEPCTGCQVSPGGSEVLPLPFPQHASVETPTAHTSGLQSSERPGRADVTSGFGRRLGSLLPAEAGVVPRVMNGEAWPCWFYFIFFCSICS